MKKKLSLLLLMMTLIFVLPACGQHDVDIDSDEIAEEVEENAEEAPDPEADEVVPVESVMDIVSDGEGYSKEGDHYVWESDEDGVKAKYTFTVSGNDITMEGVLDYGKDNAATAKEYKADPESMNSIPADFLMEFASYANNEKANMKYTLFVGDDKVAEGTMSYTEADEIMSELID